MADYGMEDSSDYNGHYSKSTPATRVHKIIFIIIAIAVVAFFTVAIIKAI